MDYWKECVSESFDDAGIVATKEQIDIVASWVDGAHENYGMAFGYDAIPNPMLTEVENLKAKIAKLEELHERQIHGIKKGVANRRNVDIHDVHIEEDGHVTYDLM
jgi:Cys-tRNA synthase (O-phospho-L-seryl-tRNA:Cys-tRNA synthase)